MRKNIIEKIEIPEGVEISVNGSLISVKSGDKENQKRMNLTNIDVKIEGNEVILDAKKASKRELKMIGTIKSHITNMMRGMKEEFEYKLAIEFVHFPMTVEMNNGEIVIKNFLGEKKPRVMKVIENVNIEIGKKEIIVKSYDKEVAGQMAANLEKLTKVKGKDIRKFQDGIYITSKAGKAI